MRTTVRAAAAALLLQAFCVAANAGAKDDLEQFQAAAQAGLAAYQNGDYAAADTALTAAQTFGPQRSTVHLYLARIASRRGDAARAFRELNRYADMGMSADLDGDENFAPLRSSTDYAAVKTRFGYNAAPLCPCTTIYEGTTEPFIAEGIARDRRPNRILVGSVRTGRIFTIANGKLSPFTRLASGYSAFGIAADLKRDVLWVAGATLPQTEGAAPDQFGRAGLFEFELGSGGQLLFLPPPNDAKHAFGDLAIAPDGTVYVTDTAEGSLFRAYNGKLERVGAEGMFVSPQGIAIDREGKAAVVADYAMGLMHVDLTTGAVSPVGVASDVTTLGIDGLVLRGDGSFVATQNGAGPNRVIAFRLFPNWTAMTGGAVVLARGPEVADISLAAADGNNLYVVGVSQWSAFDEDGAAPARPVPAWKVIRLAL